jgi:hypothetical protein
MKQLRENGITSGIPTVPDDKAETHELTVENVRIIEIGGEPTVYITADNGNVYKALFESDESLILIRIGDKLVIKCTATETEGLYTLITWTKP